MKTPQHLVLMIACLLSAILYSGCDRNGSTTSESNSFKGKQPSVDRVQDGPIGITYGLGTDIYFSLSTDEGKSFNTELVGSMNDLVLGMASGPRLAMDKAYHAIVAPSKNGNLVAWRKPMGSINWEGPFAVNDVNGAAMEGLSDVTFGTNGTLYATWIDTRSDSPENHENMDHGPQLEESTEHEVEPVHVSKEEIMKEIGEMPEGAKDVRMYPGSDGKMYWVVLDDQGNALKAKDMDSYRKFKSQNENRPKSNGKIYLAKSDDGGATWSQSQLVYTSPDGSVCECCMPSIQATKTGVTIMFRNNVGGARDLYLVESKDNGNSFGQPLKLGTGSWQINGCPMDGGGFLVSSKTDQIKTVWQRKGEVFSSTPTSEEELMGTGKSPSIAESGDGYYFAWSYMNSILIKTPAAPIPQNIGTGKNPQLIGSDNTALVIWENEGEILIRKIM